MSRKPAEIDLHPHPFPGGVYRAHCAYVVDGDTYDFLVDLGMYQYAYATVRLRGIDTPEIYRPKTEEERAAGYAAKDAVEQVLLNRPALIHTHKDTTSFGRFVADVSYLSDDGEWRDLGEYLTELGFAAG